MPFRLVDETWLTKETNKVRGCLLQYMQRGVEYTGAQLLTRLDYCGLHYNQATIAEIAARLIADGTLEQG